MQAELRSRARPSRPASASQTVAATTDAGGHFTFLSLAPDTYTVSVTKDGYNPTTFPGVTIFADQSQTLALRMQKGLKTIATVGARASGNLVKSGVRRPTSIPLTRPRRPPFRASAAAAISIAPTRRSLRFPA